MINSMLREISITR